MAKQPHSEDVSADFKTLSHMTEIEAKINSKLQEIESLFANNDKQGGGHSAAAPILIKNSSTLINSGLNQLNNK
jgi:uncharacterized small protein (DUF1192 family)